MSLTVGVDVGGTKVAAGVVDESGVVLAQTRRPTPSDSPEDTAATIAEVVAELRADREVEAVGIGAAGWVDADRARVLFAPNLAWRDEPLRDRVSDLVGLPVVVENDANAAAWAESRFGAGRGERNLVVLTLGTGIGGGLILDGALFRGSHGLAGEPGHIAYIGEGEPCGCGSRGCWERYASGTALERIARARSAADPAAAAALVERAGAAEAIKGTDVTEAALAGDALARDLLAEVGAHLGRGIASLVTLLDPGAVVVGGGLAAAGELLLEPARRSFAETLPGQGHRPAVDIRPAALGNLAGLVGAADLARGSG